MKREKTMCAVDGRPIRGRAHRWGQRIMCGRCYRYFTRNVRIAREPRPTPPSPRPGLFTRLWQALMAWGGHPRFDDTSD